MLHGEPVAGQCLGDPRRRLDFLERRLGVRVDAMRQVEDLAAGRLDSVGEPALRVGSRAGRRDVSERTGQGDLLGR
jgi:hypothetical protein